MGHIIENDFFFITENGELWRKANTFFSEKKIADVPVDNFTESVSQLEKTFSEFKEKADSALSELKQNAEQYKLPESVNAIISDAANVLAIGDFENVIQPYVDFLTEKGISLGVSEQEDTEIGSNASSNPEQQLSEEKEESAVVEVIVNEGISTEEDESEDETESSEDDDSEEEDDDHDYDDSESIRFYKKLMDKAEDALEIHDLSLAGHQLDDIRFKWSDGPDIEDEDAEKYKELQRRLEDIHSEIQEKKSAHFDELTKRRNDNLERKKQLLERFKSIVDKKRWSAINDVRYIQHRWEEIKNIPHEWVERLDTQYQGLVSTFEESRVEYLVAQKQKEEDNLVVKLAILDKISGLNSTIDPSTAQWNSLDSELEALSAQWKKTGRVAREKEQEVWDSFHKEIHKYEDLKYKHNAAFRKKLDKNLARRTALCEKSEALMAREDLAEAARLINVYHKEWKDNGPVPYEVSESLWSRFKTASDAFNKKKNDNIDLVREQEQANYDAKVQLIEKAKALVDPSDFVKSTKEVESLHEEWKNIGPVPRRKSKKVWKDFKKVLDEFYKGKREFFRSQRQEQKDNLKTKREIIDKIVALFEHENAEEAITEVKALQKQYAEIGFVPIKYKNKLWKQYRDACDKVYQRARSEKKSNASSHSSYKSEGHGGAAKPNQEIQKLKRECDRLRQEILHYGDTMTFIKPNKQGLKLREEIQKKIDASKVVLQEKEAAVDTLEQEQKIDNVD